MTNRMALASVAFTVVAVIPICFISTQRTPATRIEAVLISPQVGGDGVVESSATQRVPLTFDLKNTGRTPVSNLAVRVGCSCQIRSGPLPSTLEPGTSIRVTVEVISPAAGRARREVPIVCQSTGELLTTVSVDLRVPVQAPSWLDGPRAATFTFVAGRPANGELLWEAIEEPTAPHWVDDLKILPADFSEVSFRVEERPWGEDQRFCLRRYRVSLSLSQPTIGKRTGNLIVTHSGQDESPSGIPISVAVLPAVSVIPSTIELCGSTTEAPKRSAMVRIIDRSGSDSEFVPQFDEALLRVSRTGENPSGSRAFRIEAHAVVQTPTSTEVVFVATGVEPCILKVKIVPQ